MSTDPTRFIMYQPGEPLPDSDLRTLFWGLVRHLTAIREQLGHSSHQQLLLACELDEALAYCRKCLGESDSAGIRAAICDLVRLYPSTTGKAFSVIHEEQSERWSE